MKKKMPNPGKLLFLPAVAGELRSGELRSGPRGDRDRSETFDAPVGFLPAAEIHAWVCVNAPMRSSLSFISLLLSIDQPLGH